MKQHEKTYKGALLICGAIIFIYFLQSLHLIITP